MPIFIKRGKTPFLLQRILAILGAVTKLTFTKTTLMAKQTKKSIRKTVRSSLSGTLPKGEATRMVRAYFERLMNSGATNLPVFPEAVCFTVAELRTFLDSAEKTVNPDPNNPVPPNQIGVAIMPAFRNGKVTFALVSTRFTQNKLDQQVTSINNPVTGIHYPPVAKAKTKSLKKTMMAAGVPGEEPPVGDDAYDSGSVWP
jgi:hypothetical protein